MRHESQLQSIQCGDSSFFLDISQPPFVLFFHDAYRYQQNFMERYPRWQTTPSDLYLAQPRKHPSSNHLPRPSQTQFACGALILMSLLLFFCPRITQCPRKRPMAQYTLLGPLFLQYPYQTIILKKKIVFKKYIYIYIYSLHFRKSLFHD